jgi:hypothetical protein
MAIAKKVAKPAQKAAPAKSAVQATVTLKHLAAALADSHEIAKKQAEAVLGEFGNVDHPPSEEGRQNPSDRSRHPASTQACSADGTEPGDRRGHQD